MSDPVVIKSYGVLSGSIVSDGVLYGSLLLPVGYENYIGPYKVTPKIEPQSLKTADKYMTQDVTINSIPFYEVSNQKGITIIIGGD